MIQDHSYVMVESAIRTSRVMGMTACEAPATGVDAAGGFCCNDECGFCIPLPPAKLHFSSPHSQQALMTSIDQKQGTRRRWHWLRVAIHGTPPAFMEHPPPHPFPSVLAVRLHVAVNIPKKSSSSNKLRPNGPRPPPPPALRLDPLLLDLAA